MSEGKRIAIKASLPNGDVSYVAADHIRKLRVERRGDKSYGETWFVRAITKDVDWVIVDFATSQAEAEARAHEIARRLWLVADVPDQAFLDDSGLARRD